MAELRQPDKHDEALLKEIRDRYDYGQDEWREIRKEAAEDMRVVAGDPWKPSERSQREEAGRPCIALDEIGQYINQTVNGVREHKRAIQVTATGNGANDTWAEKRANLIRQIEYRSNAQTAYTTGFENTIQRSYGCWRIKADFIGPKSFDQELLIDPIPNPDLVTPDPDFQVPSGDDMQWLFYEESWAFRDYKRKWPNAVVRDFEGTWAELAPKWLSRERIKIAEYWRIDPVDDVLVRVQLPTGQIADVFESELADYTDVKRGKVLQRRDVEVPQVQKYLTNGVEILERTDWPGASIPWVMCLGKVLYVNGDGATKRLIQSQVRQARGPAMLYCYYRTAEAEQVGMATKFPWFIRRGSLTEDQKLKLQRSFHEPIAFIEVDVTNDNMPQGFTPEMPVRNTFVPEIQALEVGAEGARRAIQAAMGISPLPTSAQRRNEKSGVALREMRDAEQTGSFHFVDHYELALTRTGALLNQVIPFYYDTAKDVTVRDAAGEPEQIRINDPQTPDSVDLTKGDYDITLGSGPAVQSEREAANDFSDKLVDNLQVIAAVSGPQAAAKILGLAVKLKNIGPLGQEMADIISPDDQNQAPLPPDVQQQLQQGQLAMQAAQEMQRKLETKEVERQSDLEREQLKQQAETERTRLKIASDHAIEKTKIVADLLKTRATLEVQQTEAMIDQQTKELDAQVALAGEREARQDAATESQLDREQAATEADLARQHATQERRESQPPAV